ncbi:Acetylocholine receptor beta subunit 29 [Aphelenchoides besseyi]|nr:Acetylocholine receptor beta subunit 29 [Aphelenchoides besseyi]
MKIFAFSIFIFAYQTHGSDDEERLMMDVFRGYNNLIQPVKHMNQTPQIVKLALQLYLLINVDEKDQTMNTNVWLTLKWTDFQMTWNPTHYGGLKEIRVSPDKVWLPDIVLFNNADGNYEVSFMCNVVIGHEGNMLWVPPALYKSSCILDVEYFPFDEQTCHLVFGSWTYNQDEIHMDFIQAEMIDLSVFQTSSIWDLIDAPASLVNKRSRMEFQVRIRRKALFYTVVLIIPTVLMAVLNLAVFFLPADSTEKVTLCISILLSIVVFLLLVSKILPPTSSTIPLIAKYLLLTLVLNIVTIMVTVIILNVYHRGPTTHRMPNWVQFVFLKVIPRLLCMKRPKPLMPKKIPPVRSGLMVLPGIGEFSNPPIPVHHPHCSAAQVQEPLKSYHTHEDQLENLDPTTSSFYPLTPEATRAIDSIEYITDHLKKDEEYKIKRDDWKYVAMVIDRFLLFVFAGVTLGGTVGILLSAPDIFVGINQEKQLQRLINLYQSPREM